MTRAERVYVDLKDSLCYAGYHHFCLVVDDINKTIDELRRRGVPIVEEPFDIVEINRRLAFFADPWGNLIELAQENLVRAGVIRLPIQLTGKVEGFILHAMLFW